MDTSDRARQRGRGWKVLTATSAVLQALFATSECFERSARTLLGSSERAAIGAAAQTVANSLSVARAAEALGVATPDTFQVLGAGSSYGVDLVRFSRAASVHEVRARELNIGLLLMRRIEGPRIVAHSLAAVLCDMTEIQHKSKHAARKPEPQSTTTRLQMRTS